MFRDDRGGTAVDGALRGTLDTIPVGIALYDGTGRPLAVNRAARELLGDLAYQSLDAWGRTPRFRTRGGQPIPPEDLPPVATRRDGAPRRGVELVLEKADGTSSDLLVSSEAVLDPSGTVRQVSCSVTGLDHVRVGEETVRRSAKIDAVAAVAHSLAGPTNDVLTAIRGYCDLALERMEPDHPVRTILAEIEQAGRRASSLNDRLLAFGAREVPVPEPVHLHDWLKRHRERLARLAGDRVQLDTHGQADAWSVLVDRRLLDQMVTNLVSNACEAMVDGGTLRIETRQVQIDPSLAPLLGAESPGTYGVIAITDSGPGVEEGILPHVFTPFFSTRPASLGLGLPTVDRLVRRQGGFLRIENRRGRGCSVLVHLPVSAHAPMVERVEPSTLTATLGRPLRVLLVEDDVVLRALLGEVLESEQMEVLQAPTAVDGARVAEEHPGPIDLLLCDVVLPGESGDHLARRLRELRPELRVLMMSGCSDAARLSEVLGEGTPFLPKPFSPDALRSRLRDLFAAA